MSDIMWDKGMLLRAIGKGAKLDYTCFYGHTPASGIYACFSQWFPCEFVDGDHTQYVNAEQYMMAAKALLFGDTTTLKRIMSTNDPGEAKRLGRQVSNFDKDIWDANCRQIVFDGNVLKFEQNIELKKILLDTKDTILVECAPRDTVWGIGLDRHNPATQEPNKWRGQNYLGFALTQVRQFLLKGGIVDGR